MEPLSIKSAHSSESGREGFLLQRRVSKARKTGCGQAGWKGGMTGEKIRACFTWRPACSQEGLSAGSG